MDANLKSKVDFYIKQLDLQVHPDGECFAGTYESKHRIVKTRYLKNLRVTEYG